MRWCPSYHVACRLQDKILLQMGLVRSGKPVPLDKLIQDAKSKPLKPVELASLVKAWESMEDRKRILRGKGLPKPVEGDTGRRKKPSALATFSES